MENSSDRFSIVSAEHRAIIFEEGMLDRAVYNSRDKQVKDYVARIVAIYKEYFDAGFDERCPYCHDRMIKYFKRKREKQALKDKEASRLALKIGEAERREILELSLIDIANAQHNDQAMYYLKKAWIKFVNPNFRSDCDRCLPFVLDQFREMKPFLEKLNESNNLLNAVQ